MDKSVKKLMIRFAISVAILYILYFAMEFLRFTNIIPSLNSIRIYYDVAFTVILGLVGLVGISFSVHTLITNAKKNIAKENNGGMANDNNRGAK
jgi:hypothetical protein